MAKTKLGFEDFIQVVDDGNKAYVTQLHEEMMAQGCQLEVKEAKSGPMVSYLWNKKTLVNFVFRKAGIIIRLYGTRVKDYMEFLETLPEGMVESILVAPVCKRLVNPADCNPKCAMGYDFILRGEHLQKCRINAFMFPLCPENNPFIRTFLNLELRARG